jgi:ATP-dependent RNA helicase DDX31/DBP7
LKEVGFDKLTHVQKVGIPSLIKEKNVVLKSETGSGKTLAYLVPLIEHLSKYSLEVEKISRENGTYAVVIMCLD